ncbi:MAG: single-stranded DNA-binding protein [Bacteroidales bacterium]|nr:single-stranded DNA-binding protein [Bacteroidales bacterium]
MQHQDINRIEICGKVGTVRLNEVQGLKVANFSVATECVFVKNDGFIVSETTWHNVTSWQKEDGPSLDDLQKGCRVHLTGRLRTQRYTAADGTERNYNEIITDNLKIVKE